MLLAQPRLTCSYIHTFYTCSFETQKAHANHSLISRLNPPPWQHTKPPRRIAPVCACMRSSPHTLRTRAIKGKVGCRDTHPHEVPVKTCLLDGFVCAEVQGQAGGEHSKACLNPPPPTPPTPIPHPHPHPTLPQQVSHPSMQPGSTPIHPHKHTVLLLHSVVLTGQHRFQWQRGGAGESGILGHPPPQKRRGYA